jgi:ketosteroid isomerase-like protein
MSMNPQENVKVAQQAYTNFKAGNIPALLNLVADDVEWILPEVAGVAISGTREGREEVADFFRTLNETQEVISFEPREFIAQNDQVVVLGRYSFRVRATRQQFESDWAHVFTIQNGQITHFQEFTDTAAVAVAHRKAAAA